jgi:hypothetical protein
METAQDENPFVLQRPYEGEIKEMVAGFPPISYMALACRCAETTRVQVHSVTEFALFVPSANGEVAYRSLNSVPFIN